MERGSGTSLLIMPTIELRQRVREQQAARREQNLKYRGVSYIKQYINVDGIQIRVGGEGR
jgi:hypothetical protein